MLPRTERLLLREFTAADEPAVLAYQSDPLFLRFSSGEQRSGLVQMFLDWQREQPRYRFQWAVLLPADGRLIGNCGLRKRSADAREADIGFELATDQWGRGYATELASALLCFGFEELGLHRVTAHCLAENTASARVLEKAGLRQEGRLRESEWMRDRWWDTLLYGILESEWRGGRG